MNKSKLNYKITIMKAIILNCIQIQIPSAYKRTILVPLWSDLKKYSYLLGLSHTGFWLNTTNKKIKYAIGYKKAI